MQIVRLNRFYSDLKSTLGVVEVDSLNFPLYACELAWRFNEKNNSCIPVGNYKVVRHKSNKFGDCFKILDVPNRSDVLIHVGNTHNNTEGCILLGLNLGSLNDEEAVLRSGDAFKLFNTLINDDFELRIKELK